MFNLNPLLRITKLAAAAAASAPCRAVHPDFGATTSVRGDDMQPITCGARSTLHQGKHRARLAGGVVLRWDGDR